MVRRIASFAALLAFCGAYLVGVVKAVAPMDRLARAGFSMVVTFAIVAVGTWIVQRLVLSNLDHELSRSEGDEP